MSDRIEYKRRLVRSLTHRIAHHIEDGDVVFARSKMTGRVVLVVALGVGELPEQILDNPGDGVISHLVMTLAGGDA